MTNFIIQTIEKDGVICYKIEDGRIVNPQTFETCDYDYISTEFGGYKDFFKSKPLSEFEQKKFSEELKLFEKEDEEKRIQKAAFEFFQWGGGDKSNLPNILKRHKLQDYHISSVLEEYKEICYCCCEE